MDSNKKIVVVGLGKTGLSCVDYLVAHGSGVAVIDSREQPHGLDLLQKKYPQIASHFGSLECELLAAADEIVLSPGVSRQEAAIQQQIQRGISVIGDIELFARHAKAPIVAITGSNGKSTVTSLVAAMAEAAGVEVRVGGNLGTPALALLQNSEPDLYVLELSSFQLESTYSLQPAAAVVLNISADHMDRYASVAEYKAAKMHIYRNCKTAVINPDVTSVIPDAENLFFSLQKPAKKEFGVTDNYLAFAEKKLIAIKELPLQGQHQVENYLAALALGYAVNLSFDAMLKAIAKFTGLPHRCQLIANAKGVKWYNDSKATNVGAAVAAINGLGQTISGKIVLIAGGQGKDADFSALAPAVEQYVRNVILIGQDAKKIAAVIPAAGKITYAESLDVAVKLAAEAAQIGDIVLLSPACASFDMFNNFEHRGEEFIKAVAKIATAV